jgi:NADH-quinone oxidoreductase subunit L
MAGPTPVSALIHAATMVTAGVYMICRMSFMFSLAPVTMGIVSIVGAATALFAASIGLAQNDIKKVLAYSTVSQLGYMIAAAGVAAYSAAMFHLLTHAFFKACLFLCAGSVIHALGGEQDIRKMGGLYSKLPDTAFTFLVSTLAIAGIPPLSGFFSKDEIVWMAFISRNDAFPGLNFAVFGALAAAALMTSLYMFRLYYMVFGGKYRGEAHPHESPGVMLWPLFLLSSFTIVGGLFGMPEWLSHALRSVHGLFTTEPRLLDNGVETFLEPSLETPGSNMYFAWLGGGWEMALVIFSVLLAVTGWAVARRMYAAGDAGPGDSVAGRAGWLYRAISAKWYVDEIYEFAIVRPFWAVSGWLYAKVDGVLIEKAGIGGPVRALQLSGWVMRRWQNGNMQRYLAAMLIGAAALLYVMTR